MQYPGGKNGAGIVQRIINQLPPHRVYVEAFAGSAAVWRHKTPAEWSILIDADRNSLDTLLPNDRVWCGKQFHAPASPVPQTRFDTLLVCGDAIDWICKASLSPDWLLYLDPPYHPEAIRGPQPYRCKLDAAGHERLLTAIRDVPANVAINGYRCPAYDTALADWRRIDYPTMSRGGIRTESLWMNYQNPTRLHCVRWLGDSRREREKLARRSRNLVAKLRRLPELERRQLLAAVVEQFGAEIER